MSKKIQYRHPHYPGQSFTHTKIDDGPAGAMVQLPSGDIRRVRHEDIGEKPLVFNRPGRDTLDGIAARYPVPAATPSAAKVPSGMPKGGVGNAPVTQTQPTLAHPSLAFEIGHDVYYQRHDMPEPKVGRIVNKGKDGALVGLPGLEPIPVRWHHVIQRSSLDLTPDENLDAAESLHKMGVPIDPTNLYVRSGEAKKGNQSMQALFQALAAEGVPIDLKRISSAPESDLRRLLARLTEDHPSEESPNEQYRNYPTAAAARGTNRGNAGT